MIKHGTRPTYPSRKDWDFHGTFGSIAPAEFPPEYNTDAGLTNYNQNAMGLPYGCTDCTSADLSTDATQNIKNPYDLEEVTHANALGGYDIRKSLDAAMKMGWFSAYFNVRSHQLDAFDTLRLAILSGGLELRSVSIGTPWYPIFETVGDDGRLNAPHTFDLTNATWHNYACKGWVEKDGQPYLKIKSWQGPTYADKGFCYMSRALYNSLMMVPGSAAFTATTIKPDTIVTVDMGPIQWLLVYLKTLLGYAY